MFDPETNPEPSDLKNGNKNDQNMIGDEGLSMKEIFDICSPDGSSPGYMGDGMWVNSDGHMEER